jgi:hypothetical protein
MRVSSTSEAGVAPADPRYKTVDLHLATCVNIQAFVDAQDSQGVTVFDEIWDAVNTELVINIFDLNMSVDEATQLACEAVDAQLEAQRSS